MSEHIQVPATVSPYRFSPNPDAMIDFLEVLGLRVIVRRDDYAILQGRGGRVAVHPLATAESAAEVRTSLCLDVPDAVAAVDRLSAAGVEANWWDESWGRQAKAASPDGLISLNAEMGDFHGYEVQQARPSTVTVVAVVFTAAMDPLTDFYARFGFVPGDDEARGWRPLRATDDRGVIGLHSVGSTGAEAAGVDENGYVTAPLGFETSEPLDALAERLRAAGHPVQNATADGPGFSGRTTDILAVTDPDGEVIEIHPARG